MKAKELTDKQLIKIGKYAVKLSKDNNEYVEDMGFILLCRYIRNIERPRKKS